VTQTTRFQVYFFAQNISPPKKTTSNMTKPKNKKLSKRFGYIPVATILQKKELTRLIVDYVMAFKKHGGYRWDAEMISNPAPFFYFVVTGGTEQKVLQLREKRKKIAPKEPVFLIAHPGNNSLPAALEVLARLQQENVTGRIFYLKGPEDKPRFQQIEEAVSDLVTFHALQQARIGLVGPSSDWLVASSPDTQIVPKMWGPQVVAIDLEELKATLQTMLDETIQPSLDSLVSRASQVQEPSETELQDAVRVYAATKQLAEKYHLDTIAMRCFDLILDLKTTGCFALAQLNDEGIVAGCEGDLVSTVAMLWISKLLNQSSWMANPAQMDIEHNTLWLAHCTVPRNMIEEYRLRSHFESGLGVGIQGKLSTGPATVLRLGGKTLERIWLADGEILQSGHADNLCRTQVKVRLTRDGDVEKLLSTPLGNHLVLVQGHHAHRLRSWWETMIA